MRLLLLISGVGLLLAGAASGEPGQRLQTPREKSDLPKPKPERRAVNPCAQFGAGFARIEGSDTCIQIGGSVGIGVGGSLGRGR